MGVAASLACPGARLETACHPTADRLLRKCLVHGALSLPPIEVGDLLVVEDVSAFAGGIEKAENQLQLCLQTVGFIAENYIQLADALIAGDERFDRLVLEQKNDDRDAYFKKLQTQLNIAKAALVKVTEAYTASTKASAKKRFHLPRICV